MGRKRCEVLSNDALELAEEWDVKIRELRRKKEAALKKLAEKQDKERTKMAEKILKVIYEVCGRVDEDIINAFCKYIVENNVQVKEACVTGVTVPGENEESEQMIVNDMNTPVSSGMRGLFS